MNNRAFEDVTSVFLDAHKKRTSFPFYDFCIIAFETSRTVQILPITISNSKIKFFIMRIATLTMKKLFIYFLLKNIGSVRRLNSFL